MATGVDQDDGKELKDKSEIDILCDNFIKLLSEYFHAKDRLDRMPKMRAKALGEIDEVIKAISELTTMAAPNFVVANIKRRLQEQKIPALEDLSAEAEQNETNRVKELVREIRSVTDGPKLKEIINRLSHNVLLERLTIGEAKEVLRFLLLKAKKEPEILGGVDEQTRIELQEIADGKRVATSAKFSQIFAGIARNIK